MKHLRLLLLLLFTSCTDSSCICYAYSIDRPETSEPIFYSENCGSHNKEITIGFDGKIVRCELKDD